MNRTPIVSLLVLVVVAVLGCGGAVSAQTWRSALYPNNWAPGFKDAQGRFLHDFSYAGYHRGEKPIPTTVPGSVFDVTQAPYNADPSGAADSSAAIQDAIDAAGAAGGGVVYLPAGTYRLSFGSSGRSNAALWIHDDGVVMRGAGAASTRLFLDETVTRSTSMIRVSPTAGGDWHNSIGTVATLSVDLTNQQDVIPVPDARAFTVGDWIVLRADATSAYIAEHGMTGVWTTSAVTGVVFYREVMEVSTSQQTITLDTPIRYPMKVRDNLRIYRVREPIREAAIEDLSIGMRETQKSGFGDSAYNTQGTAAYDLHQSDGILVAHGRNCWIDGVSTYRPTVNSGNHHLHSDGIVLSHSRMVTVSNCYIAFPQYEGGGGNGYGFIAQGADCLFVDSHAEHTRHNFDLKSMRSTGNVFLRCRGTDPRYPSDFHMHMSIANLFDSSIMDGDYIEPSYRAFGTHGHSTTQSVIWNTTGLKYHSRLPYIVDSRQYGYGYVIGTSGPASAVRSSPTIVNGNPTAPEDWVEGVGTGGTLEPTSLYEDQLARRLGSNGGMASYRTFGTACGPILRPTGNGVPALGSIFSLAISNPTNSSALGLIGFSQQTIDLTVAGAPGCFLYAPVDLMAPVTTLFGNSLWTLPIPMDPTLSGITFYQQVALLIGSANPLGAVVTDAGEGVIGR